MKSSEFIDTDLDTLDSNNGKSGSGNGAKNTAANSMTPNGRAEIDARVEQARQQMLDLRRQQEELEKERQELEDLRRREEEFERGKIEMLDELSRTIGVIEQEEFEHHKSSTSLANFREIYQDYVRQLNDIRETEWTSLDLKTQLNKAFAVVEASRAELNKGRAQLTCLGDGPMKLSMDNDNAPSRTMSSSLSAQEASFDFALEVKKGIARNLGLIILAVVALLYLLLHNK
jgi:chromosome segregation ATPase